MSTIIPSSQYSNHPLFTISDTSLIERFFSRLSVSRTDTVSYICRTFSHIPYENISKINVLETKKNAWKRLPETVLSDFFVYGAGGTCFSLTATLIALFSSRQIQSFPILADRHYGPNTHSAVVLITNNQLSLIDPGYLIHHPISIPINGTVEEKRSFNTVAITATDNGKLLELHTILNNDRRYRLTYKLTPASPEQFEQAWNDSFLFDMMHYPVLTTVLNDTHIYLQGTRLKINRNGVRTTYEIEDNTIPSDITHSLRLKLLLARYGKK